MQHWTGSSLLVKKNQASILGLVADPMFVISDAFIDNVDIFFWLACVCMVSLFANRTNRLPDSGIPSGRMFVPSQFYLGWNVEKNGKKISGEIFVKNPAQSSKSCAPSPFVGHNNGE